MRIDERDSEARRVRTEDLIRQIQEHQSREAALDAAQKPDLDPNKKLDDASDPSKIDAQAQQVQELALRATVQQVDQTKETQSGVEKADEAVKTADRQQDRGQDWQAYAQIQEQQKLPPSVEEIKAEEARQDQQRLNVGELVNQMRIQSGRIGG